MTRPNTGVDAAPCLAAREGDALHPSTTARDAVHLLPGSPALLYVPTGNDYVALPQIRGADGALESVNVLHMGFRGLLEMGGDPFLAPFVRVGGQDAAIAGLRWERLAHWIPAATGTAGELQVRITYLAPVDQRGFALSYTITAGPEPVTVEWGWQGRWRFTRHVINESRPLNGTPAIIDSRTWSRGPVLEFLAAVPVLALAPLGEDGTGACARAAGDRKLELRQEVALMPGGSAQFNVFWGVGLEEVGAATAAREMQRTGWARLRERTLSWLGQHCGSAGDPALDQVLNLNLHFNRFYATGRTIDTEERVCVTSRSPRYYVSAAFWDRDALMWSFPALLATDPECAREVLEYYFTRQARNAGVHSRYIDGVVLEPGFELDELMAPALAVAAYLDATGDVEVLQRLPVLATFDRIRRELAARRHPGAEIFETELLPTDDPAGFPYVTFDNVLVWKGLRAMARVSTAAGLGDIREDELEVQAERVAAAIWQHCVVPGPAGPCFAWEVDLKGGFRLYDEPPGSLQLLPHLGFCAEDDPVYLNTLQLIRSPDNPYAFAGQPFAELGCAHAPYPWVLSIANSLLMPTRREQARELLLRAELDGGIACESIDPATGRAATGQAFATCAGFLAHALLTKS